jgi:hypothetical protein
MAGTRPGHDDGGAMARAAGMSLAAENVIRIFYDETAAAKLRRGRFALKA